MLISTCARRPSPPAPMNTRAKLSRPRGLWKAARGTPKPCLDAETASKRPHPDDHYPRHRDEDDGNLSDGDCCDSDSSTNSSSKRFRLSDSPPTSEEETQDEVIFWDYSRKCSSQPNPVSRWTTRSRVMNISSTAGSGQSTQDRATYTLEDWQDLKELFTNAVDMYESESAPISIHMSNL